MILMSSDGKSSSYYIPCALRGQEAVFSIFGRGTRGQSGPIRRGQLILIHSNWPPAHTRRGPNFLKIFRFASTFSCSYRQNRSYYKAHRAKGQRKTSNRAHPPALRLLTAHGTVGENGPSGRSVENIPRNKVSRCARYPSEVQPYGLATFWVLFVRTKSTRGVRGRAAPGLTPEELPPPAPAPPDGRGRPPRRSPGPTGTASASALCRRDGQ